VSNLLTLVHPLAFILYRQHYQAAVISQNPGLANPEISKIIGEQWRKLPQTIKDEWKNLAEVIANQAAVVQHRCSSC
jgi:HMG box factor